MSTFLVDGEVAGSWRHGGGRGVIDPFAPVPAPVSKELKAEAERLADLHR